MLILDEYLDSWNYSFIIVALIALTIGTFFTLRSINKQENEEQQNLNKEDTGKSSNEVHE